jgi:hypothetical protein
MLAISASDILKILDKLPLWKTLSTLPARLDALERRVAALEGASAKNQADAINCPACGGAMKFVAERPDPAFGRLGVKERDLRCECGHATTLQWTQERGYR